MALLRVPRNRTARSREAFVSHSALPFSPIMASDSIVLAKSVTRDRGQIEPSLL
jgi:hypothetical protein